MCRMPLGKAGTVGGRQTRRVLDVSRPLAGGALCQTVGKNIGFYAYRTNNGPVFYLIRT